jgi:hypothetical protein
MPCHVADVDYCAGCMDDDAEYVSVADWESGEAVVL